MGQVGDIQDLDPFGIAGVGIAELGLDRPRMLQERLAQHGGDRRVLRIFERDHHETGVAGNVGIRPDDRDRPSPL